MMVAQNGRGAPHNFIGALCAPNADGRAKVLRDLLG